MTHNQEENLPDEVTICTLVKQEHSKKKIAAVDTGASLIYSVVVGTTLDYFASRLRGYSILVSRAYNSTTSLCLGAAYGYWREKIYDAVHTVNQSSKLRKGATELLAMNSFWTNLYSIGVAVSTHFGEGQVDWLKVGDGTTTLLVLSPLISISNGIWMDKFRSWFNIPPASDGAYKLE